MVSYVTIWTPNELSKINVSTSRPINIIETLRLLRHNINYYGYKPNIEEVEYAVNFAKDSYKDVYNQIVKMIKKE